MSTTFLLKCPGCKKTFKSFHTLKKHATIAHNPEVDVEDIHPEFQDKTISRSIPESQLLEDEQGPYKRWLAGVAEQMNASFHPRLPGKTIL